MALCVQFSNAIAMRGTVAWRQKDHAWSHGTATPLPAHVPISQNWLLLTQKWTGRTPRAGASVRPGRSSSAGSASSGGYRQWVFSGFVGEKDRAFRWVRRREGDGGMKGVIGAVGGALGGERDRDARRDPLQQDVEGSEGSGSKGSGSESEEEEDEGLAVRKGGLEKTAEEEALELLEWPAICRQVAKFCDTPMGFELATSAALPFGGSLRESEELLSETSAALCLPHRLDFEGALDITAVLRRTVEGKVCSVADALAVLSLLRAGESLKKQLDDLSEFFMHEEVEVGLGVEPAPPPGGVGSAKSLQKEAEGERKEERDRLVAPNKLPNSPGAGGGPLSPLRNALAPNVTPSLTALQREVERCIDPTLRSVRDDASPDLLSCRATRRSNMRDLDALLRSEARRLVKEGGIVTADAAVTRRRGRLCVAVRANAKQLLPGGVTLDSSNTGTTLFVEPGPAVALNNREAELAAREAAAEAEVMGGLAELVAENSEGLRGMSSAIVRVDLACARARHALWLKGVMPKLVAANPCLPSIAEETDGEGGGVAEMAVREGRVPQAGVIPGRLVNEEGAKEAGAREEDLDTSRRESGRSAGLEMVRIRGIRHPLLLGSALTSSQAAAEAAAGAGESPEAAVVPVDISVRRGVRVVAISGPNAGGKTATLKTLGVAALMAKAGLFLPIADATAAAAAASSPAPPGSSLSLKPVLPWFDRVLADIGDEQSLEQSLSTFSGHIRRTIRVLRAATPLSLVLLDEVGSGTDPSEGAALAKAVLMHLAGSPNPAEYDTDGTHGRLKDSDGNGREEDHVESTAVGSDGGGDSKHGVGGQRGACLTVTTTHYSQLKALKAADERFEDACVEFNVATLRPTFRVLWGQAGTSNALSIATAKGFPPTLVARARQLLGQQHSGQQEQQQQKQAESREKSGLVESLVAQMERQQRSAREAAEARAGIERRHAEAKAAFDDLCLREQLLLRRQESEMKAEAAAARARIARAASAFEAAVAAVAAADAVIEGPFDSTEREDERGGVSDRGSPKGGRGGERQGRKKGVVWEMEQRAHAEVSSLASPLADVLRPAEVVTNMDGGDPTTDGQGLATHDNVSVAQAGGKSLQGLRAEDRSSQLLVNKGRMKFTTWRPREGEEVLVKKLGGKVARVVSVDGNECHVKLGSLGLTVVVGDLLPKQAVHKRL